MPAPSAELVPLESGDRLTRTEFHRRYCARPDIRKAELILGVVYVSSPASGRHGRPHGFLVTRLGHYVAQTPDVVMMVETSIFFDDDGEVQPDAFLFRDPPPPGGARLNDAGYVEGPPQLVAEVAYSSASYDLHDKKALYQREGVQEYVVWRVREQQLDWFRLHDGEYVRVEPDDRGVITSTAFPGLRLAVTKLLSGDLAGVLAELDAPDA